MEGETVKLSQGQQVRNLCAASTCQADFGKEIFDRISDLGLNECKVLVSNVDSQGTLEGGIMIQVLGELSNDGQGSKKFAQTFCLAPQESGFYVYNDIFRFLKDEVDSESGDEQHFEPASSTTTAEPVTNGAEKDTLFSHEVPASQSGSAAAQAEITPDTHFSGSTSAAVAEIEKAATESIHAPLETAQEVVPSPVSTPVAVTEQPKADSQSSAAVEAIAEPAVEAQPEIVKPAAPMSWAARAAANAAKASAPAAAKQATPKSASAKAVTTVSDAERKPTGSGNAAVADVTRSAFLKGISAKMTEESIRTALKQFGEFKNVEINRSKSCGFVDYLEAASCAAAIKANHVTISGETMLVEERKRDSNGKIGPKEKRFEQGRDPRTTDARRGGRGGGRGGKSIRGTATPK